MMDWFRSHHGAPTDPKWRTIAKRAGVAPGVVVSIAWALLDVASQHHDRGSIAGVDIETLADFMGYEPEDIERVLAAMTDKGVLVEQRFAAWDRRQVKREDDGAADRQREKRAREKAEREEAARKAGDQGDLLDVTQSHAASHDVTPEQSRAEQTRTEAGKPAGAHAREPACQPEIDDRDFEAGCTAALGGGRIKGSFAPMLALAGDRSRIVEVLGIEARGRPKPIGSWVLAAQIATEQLAQGVGSARAPPSPEQPAAAARIFVATGTPEWEAWDRAGRANGHPRGFPSYAQEGGRHGWYFASRWPPGGGPETLPERTLEPAS